MLSELELKQHETKPKFPEKPSEIRLRSKRGHSECNVFLSSACGDRYRLFVRQLRLDSFDFSVGLTLCLPSGEEIALARYNGSSHSHTNKLEGTRLSCTFHIHKATVRYIAISKPDGYAEETDRYSDVCGAFKALKSDYAITQVSWKSEQLELG